MNGENATEKEKERKKEDLSLMDSHFSVLRILEERTKSKRISESAREAIKKILASEQKD